MNTSKVTVKMWNAWAYKAHYLYNICMIFFVYSYVPIHLSLTNKAVVSNRSSVSKLWDALVPRLQQCVSGENDDNFDALEASSAWVYQFFMPIWLVFNGWLMDG